MSSVSEVGGRQVWYDYRIGGGEIEVASLERHWPEHHYVLEEYAAYSLVDVMRGNLFSLTHRMAHRMGREGRVERAAEVPHPIWLAIFDGSARIHAHWDECGPDDNTYLAAYRVDGRVGNSDRCLHLAYADANHDTDTILVYEARFLRSRGGWRSVIPRGRIGDPSQERLDPKQSSWGAWDLEEKKDTRQCPPKPSWFPPSVAAHPQTARAGTTWTASTRLWRRRKSPDVVRATVLKTDRIMETPAEACDWFHGAVGTSDEWTRGLFNPTLH